MSLRDSFRYLNQYDMHKKIINEYMLQKSGDTSKLRRDTSKDRRDIDVIRENHKFLWDEDDETITWEQQFAKKYYDRLFKEYCICDLSHYKENKIAMRWRIEKEVVIGKGQFICGNKSCTIEKYLRTWEVNFAYVENEEKKNALVKIRLCPECSLKLNYHSKKREVKRLKKSSKTGKSKPKEQKAKKDSSDSDSSDDKPSSSHEEQPETGSNEEKDSNPWENVKPVETKSRDEEMEEYLDELLL
ncbi:protein FRA10AC1 homolog [Atheta coriaria]|uniref:protein FRA10AC1 homolog n=1 Tax=Dalotia coriaria TaxID=877792 RepID=UPI0031F3B505